MTDRISIPALRELLEHHYYDVEKPVTLLALVEAVEAARQYRLHSTATHYGGAGVDALMRLSDALARFDFGEETEEQDRQVERHWVDGRWQP